MRSDCPESHCRFCWARVGTLGSSASVNPRPTVPTATTPVASGEALDLFPFSLSGLFSFALK